MHLIIIRNYNSKSHDVNNWISDAPYFRHLKTRQKHSHVTACQKLEQTYRKRSTSGCTSLYSMGLRSNTTLVMKK